MFCCIEKNYIFFLNYKWKIQRNRLIPCTITLHIYFLRPRIFFVSNLHRPLGLIAENFFCEVWTNSCTNRSLMHNKIVHLVQTTQFESDWKKVNDTFLFLNIEAVKKLKKFWLKSSEEYTYILTLISSVSYYKLMMLMVPSVTTICVLGFLFFKFFFHSSCKLFFHSEFLVFQKVIWIDMIVLVSSRPIFSNDVLQKNCVWRCIRYLYKYKDYHSMRMHFYSIRGQDYLSLDLNTTLL